MNINNDSRNKVMQDKQIKIIYYGPGISGKHTSLEYIQNKLCEHKIDKQDSVLDKGYLAVICSKLNKHFGLPRAKEFNIILPTYPQSKVNDPIRDKVIAGAKGFVFVADSQIERMDSNLEHLYVMEKYINNEGCKIDNFPIVFQYNKRDLPNILSVDEINQELNKFNFPYFASIATEGIGVMETFKSIINLVCK